MAEEWINSVNKQIRQPTTVPDVPEEPKPVFRAVLGRGGGGEQPSASTFTEASERSDTSVEYEDVLVPSEDSRLAKMLHTNLVDTGDEELRLNLINQQQCDPQSPLFSVKRFEELNLKPEILDGIARMNFSKPSKIQEMALPLLLKNPPDNLVAQSQSGTGKTAAFLLNVLSRIDTNFSFVQALILSPTFELAQQIGFVAEKMGYALMPPLKIVYAVKGSFAESLNGVHLVIGTPGKTLDWAFRSRILNLQYISMFILDEADVLISQENFGEQSKRLNNQLPKQCQRLLFSATYSVSVMEFARDIVFDNANLLMLKVSQQCLDNIKQYYIKCNDFEAKYKALCNIYCHTTVGLAIIFCRLKNTADILSQRFGSEGFSVIVLHGGMDIEDRATVVREFKAQKYRVLISTNVISRGLDVSLVNLIVNFDLPFIHGSDEPDYETYLHRIGRSGRFGKVGIAVNLILPREEMFVKKIETHYGRGIVHIGEEADELEYYT